MKAESSIVRTLLIAFFFTVLMLSAWAFLKLGSEAQSPGDSSIQDSGGMTSAEVAEGDAATRLTQTDAGEGAVTVSATLITAAVLEADPSVAKPEYDAEKEIVFLVALNTHSVDLLAYDPAAMTTLTTDGKEVQPVGEWQSVSDSGHHRSGYLRFPRIIDGEDISIGSGSLDLVMKGLAGIPERRLTWPLPLEQE